MKSPILLCIMDGCGISEEINGNAFKNAITPNIDYFFKNFPNCNLEASGIDVGLPDKQMGNSEVGHTNIGAGRIVVQPEQKINYDIETGVFFKNKNILEVINHTKKNDSNIHIIGLASDGGIHSDIKHLFSLLKMCKNEKINNVYLHLFTDGRDTGIKSAPKFIMELQEEMKKLDIGIISTISGRYYAMDRDNNYDRIRLAYNVIVNGDKANISSIENLFSTLYSEGITDEFIIPTVIENHPIENNDGIIVFNFRPDRLRELCTAITNPMFDAFKTKKLNNVKLVTMFPVSDTVIATSAYCHEKLDNTLGKVLENRGYSQLRIAETEKYAHVTYFFDGGCEERLNNEKRILIPSPKVKTYDLKPDMSAGIITETLLKELKNNIYDVIILNFANGDMVGHTGNYEAAVQAIEYLDTCIKRLYDEVKLLNGILIITADHGNCEKMFNSDGSVCTTHTTNKVPFLITKKEIELSNGKLADIAPTILELLGEKIPKEITGKSLIVK